MTPVFLDTSGLIALVNEDDQWHDRAVAVWDTLNEAARPLITTSLVLVEIGDGLSRLRHRSLAVKLVESLRESPDIEIVQSTEHLESEAWILFRSRPDKEWGMTDCVSMTLMHRTGVNDVFSLDHHFVQAGFAPLIPLP